MKQLMPFLLSLFFILASACTTQPILSDGDFRLILIPDTTQPEMELPVNLSFQQTGELWTGVIRNAGEKIQLEQITVTEDSILLVLPVFESKIALSGSPDLLTGYYIHTSAGRESSMPARLIRGSERFVVGEESPAFDPTGTWEVILNPGGNSQNTQVGQFSLDGKTLTGTFLSNTGDYRYLEGTVCGNKLYLSGFDGSHAVLYQAEIADENTIINGKFIGGQFWQAHWEAKRNNEITLQEATELTRLKPGFTGLEFTFPDLDNQSVSLSDDRFKNKVIIVQILGSWCPNCMDETRLLAEFYDQYNDQGLEVIGLCYEAETLEKSRAAVQKFKAGTGANYTFLYAGKASKQVASESLPMLNQIISFPTTVFIDKTGKIREIYTGFSGPGTGEHYEDLKTEMTRLIDTMLSEPLK